jgi:translation initiation factor IF-2
MSKPVYEIAQELDLSTKEVIGRLNDAGIEVKNHLAVVEDPVVERVFGEGTDVAAPNGSSEHKKPEVITSRIQ